MDKVIIMQDWYRALAQQPRDVRVEVYDAIMEYGFSGKFPSHLKPLAMGMFLLIQPQIDRMQEQYADKSAKRSAAGKKGMAERWKQPPDAEDITNITNVTNDNKNNTAYQAITSDNNKIKENKINLSEKDCDKSQSKESESPNVFFKTWNLICGSVGLPKVRGLTDKRKRKMATRLKEFAAAGLCDPENEKSVVVFLRGLFVKITNSPFLRGAVGSGWRANFDWVFENSENWRKILDGYYDNADGTTANASGRRGMFSGEEAAAIVAAGKIMHERKPDDIEPVQ